MIPVAPAHSTNAVKTNRREGDDDPVEGAMLMYIVGCYVTYLAISLVITVWVAHTLHKNGRVFLVDAFHGDAALADSANHLLVVSFYLINVGWVAVALRSDVTPSSLRQAIELVSTRIGVVLLVLGVMHFLNLYAFSRLRKRAQDAGPSGPQIGRK
jgi:hypothetical protein